MKSEALVGLWRPLPNVSRLRLFSEILRKYEMRGPFPGIQGKSWIHFWKESSVELDKGQSGNVLKYVNRTIILFYFIPCYINPFTSEIR